MEMFIFLCTLLGGIGAFYYGLQLTTEILQLNAGENIQRLIDLYTNRRLPSFFSGMSVAALVQHSSISVGPILGLLNSGLTPLVTALAFILGANLGSSLTVFFFAQPLTYLGLLFLGCALIPSLLSSNYLEKQLGKLLLGLGLLFQGLEIFREGLAGINNWPEISSLISSFAPLTLSSGLIVGSFTFLITVLLQSSVVMLGIICIISYQNLLPVPLLMVMVMAANLGTSVPLFFASLEGGANVKRAALAHLFFKLVGVLLSIALLPQLVTLLELVNYRPLVVPLFHTFFNLLVAICCFPFLVPFSKFLAKAIPKKANQPQHHELLIVDMIEDIWPSMALIQLRREVKKFRSVVQEMFLLAQHYVRAETLNAKEFYRIKEHEVTTDHAQKEITKFANKLVERQLTPKQSLQIQSYIKMASELECIADYLERTAIYKTRFHKQLPLQHPVTKEIFCLMDDVYHFFVEVSTGLDFPLKKSLNEYGDYAQELKKRADLLRDDMLTKSSSNPSEYNPLRDRVQSDMIMAFRKIRSHCYNIADGLADPSDANDDD